MSGPLDKPLLSICIPTYNRDYLIQECLDRLCPIAFKYHVQIHISDNASPDKTEEVIKTFMAYYNNIFYYKQKENIGEQNFEFILKQPKTKYRWLFGDGYAVSDEDIRLLINDLSKNDFDFYVIGAKRRTECISEKIYTSSNDLLYELGWHMTLLSSLIYRDTIIDNAYFKRYYNTYFIQTGVIFEYCAFNSFTLKFNPHISLDGIPYIKRNHWTNIAFEVFTKKWFLFIMSLPASYHYESKRKCIITHDKETKLFSIRNLLVWRSLNYFNIKTVLCYKYFITQTVALPMAVIILISCVPAGLLKFARTIYKKLSHNMIKRIT